MYMLISFVCCSVLCRTMLCFVRYLTNVPLAFCVRCLRLLSWLFCFIINRALFVCLLVVPSSSRFPVDLVLFPVCAVTSCDSFAFSFCSFSVRVVAWHERVSLLS